MTPSEDRIQQQCVMWYTNTYCLTSHNPRNIIYHVPNQNQQRLTKIGVLGGVADLVLIHNAEHVYIEMKDHKGKPSESQLDFKERVESHGYKWFLCRSLESFKEIIKKLDKSQQEM
jgi:hypothetical protein